MFFVFDDGCRKHITSYCQLKFWDGNLFVLYILDDRQGELVKYIGFAEDDIGR